MAMNTKTITIKARDLKPGDILSGGQKVISAEVRTLVGYNIEQVHITDDSHKAPVVGWTCPPDTELRVTRAA